MGRLIATCFAVVLGIALMSPLRLSAQPPTVYGPNNASSVAFWYLGPGINSCCTSMPNLYYAQTVLTIVPTNNGNPNPSIHWSTDSPSRLSISPSANGLSAVLTALGPSTYQAGYDIHVIVTYDGYPSDPFPVFINTPFTMTTSADIGSYTCQQLGAPANWVGYANDVSHGIADLLGATLIPINVKESLEKRQWLNATYSSGPLPTATPWLWNQWQGNVFIDRFTICASTPNPLNPPPTSYNPNGTTAVFNETQKFWVGTTTDFAGVCVQRGVVTLYTDHGRVSPYYTPVTNKADCNPGIVLN